MRWGISCVILAALTACTPPPRSALPTATQDPFADHERLRRVLTVLSVWDAATAEERRAAAEWVDEREADIALVRMETFAAGGQTHEVPIFAHEKTAMEFTLVPAGRFLMGSPEDEKDRDCTEVQHEVTLTRPFLIARTEVTQAAWRRVGGANDPKNKGDDLPVEMVSWLEATAWCGKAGLRLPSEAEWEYACRAGTTSPYATGDGEPGVGAAGWFDSNAGGVTHPVGRKAPNAFGLYDVHGNVYEWCSDWYAHYTGDHETDPTGPSEPTVERVVRGGCFEYPASVARSALRDVFDPRIHTEILGFRPARSVALD